MAINLMLDSSAVRMCQPCRHSPTPQQRQTFRQSSICRQAKNGCMIHASLAAPRPREKPIALIPVDAEKIALKAEIPPLRPHTASRANNRSFPTPVPWLRRLGFIHIAFDRMVNHAKAVITPDIIYWYALFEANRKELDKDRVMLGRR
ncbi:hypothetical protein NOF04DRAFT_1374341 [Fusarium oxysporum II5]|nr:hypothetical protein NOF04DRAFT_1374341 [Fusarium oxysporum II5]